MRLEHLTLTNFRGFDTFEISLDPHFTVLLGKNMAGKTAVLDGAAVALGTLFLNLSETHAREIRDDEVRQVVGLVGGVPDLQRQLPVEVTARASFGSEALSWTRRREGLETEDRENGAVRSLLRGRLRLEQPLDLPVVAQYGTQRGWRGKEVVEDNRRVGSRFDGYVGCFDISSTHGQLAAWMRRQTLIQLQRGGSYRQPQLAAVEAAVRSCIAGVARFWFDVQYEELRIEREQGDVQSFAMLSEGYRNMVAMVADIAWRASVLNPHHATDAAARAEGVVLIDEVCLHLHPAWQLSVVDDLRRTFPRIQFIVTTHSAQVVASVAREQVRLLDGNRLIAAELFVEGRDSNGLLEDVFGVPSRPASVEREIEALFRLIEDEEFVAAQGALARLQVRLGPDDTAMIRARWILDTEAAERQSSASPAS